jgi:hypothetical protein
LLPPAALVSMRLPDGQLLSVALLVKLPATAIPPPPEICDLSRNSILLSRCPLCTLPLGSGGADGCANKSASFGDGGGGGGRSQLKILSWTGLWWRSGAVVVRLVTRVDSSPTVGTSGAVFPPNAAGGVVVVAADPERMAKS